MPEGGEIAVAVPENSVLDTLIVDLLPMTGGETAATSLPQGLLSGLESGRSGLFNLAENRKEPDAPFAFLSSHSSRLSARGKAQHQSLSRALAEFSDGKSKA